MERKHYGTKENKTIILNIDETLVHSTFGKERNADLFISFKHVNDYFAISTHKRPHVDEFLKHMFSSFEVIFYTQSIDQYSNKVIDLLDPEGKAVGRLFRDS